MRTLALLFLFPALASAGRGEDLLRSIRESGLDISECYRVREITVVRDEAQFYLTDGFLIFGKPIGSTRVTALFSADVEGGEAEVLLLPPNRSERR
ncbi:MAG: peptidase rane alanine aminopeptidase, partial [Bryobacterales bacterium]|nr:peptidase rane alanine aminopeptidase [Bryobacterales bacterium]